MTLLAARADEQIANEVTQPMRSISSTTSAVNPVNAVTKVNAVKNPASAVGGRSPGGLYFEPFKAILLPTESRNTGTIRRA